MEVVFFDGYFREILFSCNFCGWTGEESELDFLSSLNLNLVCCPSCHNDDVRILNK